MKSKVYRTLLLAASTLASVAQAQVSVSPVPAARPGTSAADGVPVAPAAPFGSQPTSSALPGTTPAADPTTEAAPDTPSEVDRARQAEVRAQADYAAAQAEYQRAAVGQQWSSMPSAALPGQSLYSVFSPHAESDGTLVIRTSEPDPNALANAEEDLNIMGRILEKAVAQNSEDEQPQAMGIRLLTLPSHPPLRNLQIEGFGDVFFLNVNFPLVGPARSTGNKDEKPASNSTWDEAKRELYGPQPGVEGSNESSSKEAYDPKRVEKLKDTLLNALKNATNIRSLKPDETVMVVVNGGSTERSGLKWVSMENKLTRIRPREPVAGFGEGRGTAGAGETGYIASGGGKPAYIISTTNRSHVASDGSVLTIRARKSDIDAFANGKLNLEEFRNKTRMLVY